MGADQTSASDLKSLSGGEGSFVNLCFLVAVAEHTNSPFHLLDEFDVSFNSADC